MSHLRLLRIWLLALVVVLVGCGGHDDDTDPGDLDASSDVRRSDVASDRVTTDGASDNRDAASDIRVDTPTPTVDVRTDPAVDVRTDPAVDTRVDVRVDTIDVRTDPAVDIRADSIDVRTDPAVDIRVDSIDVRTDPTVDLRIDTTVDAPRDADASADMTIDPTVDPTIDAGCTSDNQCGPTAPHCNTNTGACVTPVALAVTPANPSIAAGTTQQFTATMTYTDASTGNVTALAVWASANTAVATMSPGTPGLATGLIQGSSTISAIFGGLAGGTQLNVTTATLTSIQVTPANASSPLGTTRPFTAMGTYSDSSTQDLTATATWASSMPAFATIAAGGVATTVALGTTSISATVGTVTAAVNFTVTSPTLVRIDVSPPNVTILTLTTQEYQATGVYSDNSTVDLTTTATWASSATTVATLNGTIATGISAGTTTISATFNGIFGSTPLTVTGATLTSIVVTPINPTAPVGFKVQFRATGNFSSGPTQDLTKDVLWSSSDDATASVSNAGGSEGLASALQAGTSTISASIAGQTGSTLLTVSTSPLASIEVLPAAPSIAPGTTQAFTATARFMDTTTLDVTDQVSWGSSALGVATVSNAAGSKGLATSVSAGTATITASLNGATGNATLTVTPATLLSIAITPANATDIVGAMINYTAMGTYSDNSTQNITALVTWNSTNPGVATISNGGGSQGAANAVAAGDTTIEATLNSITATTPLHINP
jgi:hypothetical protein